MRLLLFFARKRRRSVVAFEIDLLAVPAELVLQNVADAADHVIQAADIGLHLFPAIVLLQDLAEMVLDVAATPGPVLAAAAKGADVVEVLVLPGELLKFFAVINIFFVPGAVEEPELVALVTLGVLEEPSQHAAKGRNPRAGGDEDGVLQLFMENEVPVRAVEVDEVADFTVAEVVGHEAVLDTVEAEVELAVAKRVGSDGIGAGDEFPVGLGFADRDKLSGDEVELGHIEDVEFNVLGFFGQ